MLGFEYSLELGSWTLGAYSMADFKGHLLLFQSGSAYGMVLMRPNLSSAHGETADYG